MDPNELLEYLLEAKTPSEPLDEIAAYEASSLVSGSFVGKLHHALWLEGLPMQAATDRLESLYDNGEYNAFLYLVVLLATAVELDLPEALGEIAANKAAAPVLAAAIVEDWLEMDETCNIETE
jgi:hypothetical protein